MMKAAVLVEPGKFEIQLRPIPKPKHNEALVRIERVGICGTDLHIYNGHYAADNLPMVLGHEASGIIDALGNGVSHLHVGQRVAFDINRSCGHCYFCRQNERLNCSEISQLGIHQDGAFAEYVIWPAELLVVVPETMSAELTALAEPVACVVRAAKKAKLAMGQSVVVLGAGPIGNLHVQLLRMLGAAPIFVLDKSKDRLELAKRSGADFVTTDVEDLRHLIKEHTDNIGADVVIESVGIKGLYDLAIELMRKGGHLALFGLTDENARLDVPILDWILNENSAKGSVAGMGEDMHEAIKLLRFHRFDTEAYTSQSFALDDIGEAFVAVTSGITALKTQIIINKG